MPGAGGALTPAVTGLRIGVAPHRLWAATESELDGVLEHARLAERLGFDHLIAGSHLLDTELGPTLEPVTMLAVIAGATSRIRLATSVLILPLYNPVVLANQAATLDRLSGGRFTLGVGTGWHAGEFEAVGSPFGERGRRTDEYLATLRTLWEKDSATVKIAAAPSTPGGPEVWVGGGSTAALRRAVRFGDAWHGSGLDPKALRETHIRLRDLADAAGRPEPAVTVGGFLVPPGFDTAVEAPGHHLGGARPTAASVLDELGELAAAGATAYSLWLPVPTAQFADALAWVAEQVVAAS